MLNIKNLCLLINDHNKNINNILTQKRKATINTDYYHMYICKVEFEIKRNDIKNAE